MLESILYLIVISFMPVFELRAGIPYGILFDPNPLPWPVVFVVCVASNIMLGVFIFWAFSHLLPLIVQIKPLGRLYQMYIERTQRRFNNAVEKYGEWALIMFIGIPLPGTGAFTGAVAARLIGIKFRKFMVANILGVLLAGAVVTGVSLSGGTALEYAQRWGLLRRPPVHDEEPSQNEDSELDHTIDHSEHQSP